MKWTKTDLERYLGAEEYVDTIVIPLIPFHFSMDKDIKKDASQAELLTLFALEIEQELAGRVMLTPSYYYITKADKQSEVKRLQDWTSDIQTKPFQHIFYLTFDAGWKKEENNLDGTLLWFPAIAETEQNNAKDLLSGQVEQVVDLIRSFWT